MCFNVSKNLIWLRLTLLTKALGIDSPKFVVSSKSDDKSEKPQTTNEQEVGNWSVYNKSDNGSSAKSALNSPLVLQILLIYKTRVIYCYRVINQFVVYLFICVTFLLEFVSLLISVCFDVQICRQTGNNFYTRHRKAGYSWVAISASCYYW
jgi:hypothetical protein